MVSHVLNAAHVANLSVVGDNNPHADHAVVTRDTAENLRISGFDSTTSALEIGHAARGIVVDGAGIGIRTISGATCNISQVEITNVSTGLRLTHGTEGAFVSDFFISASDMGIYCGATGYYIMNGQVSAGGNDVVFVSDASVFMSDVTVISSSGTGTGIHVDLTGGIKITSCIFGQGRAIYHRGNGGCEVENCSMVGAFAPTIEDRVGGTFLNNTIAVASAPGTVVVGPSAVNTWFANNRLDSADPAWLTDTGGNGILAPGNLVNGAFV